MSEIKEHNNTTVKITRSARLRGDFQIPGDKSISHRSAMFAAIGNGESCLRNYSSARDCQSTLDCLEALGVKIERRSDQIIIEGVGLDGLRESSSVLETNC